MYMLGIDGGATGTVAIVADEDGTVLTSVKGPPSNFHAVGRDDARSALNQVVRDAIEAADTTLQDCKKAVFGLAGLNSEHDAQVFEDLIAPIGLPDVDIRNDIVIAWAAATHCKPGVVVIAGTGSSAYGQNKAGEAYKSLGWDYLLADQGSGYWVGLQGLQTAIKMWDGRLEEGLLLPAMLECYQLEKADDMLHLVYNTEFEKPDIARFSREVSKCAENGDKHAQRILKQAGDELAAGVCAVIKKLGLQDEKEFPVGLVGGTFRSGKWLMEAFALDIKTFAPGATISTSHFPPVLGAILYAHYRAGTLNDELIARLEETGMNAIRWKS